MDAINQFRQAMTNAGLIPPETIHGDGKLHRFSTDGKPSHKNGWHFLHLDGIPWGQAGDWSVNGGEPVCHWCAKSDKQMTQAERDSHRRRIVAMQGQRKAEQTQRQQYACEAAAVILANASPARSHEYLAAKGIQPHGVKCDGVRLVIPMRDTSGTLHSLQTIAPDGEKRFHSGGKVTGCYYSIGKPDGMVIVCEGFATGASIRESTGHAVAVAFNAVNLQPVAVALHAKYPALKIIIAADDDHLTEGNPGMTKATAAAQAVAGLVAVPVFPATRSDKYTDFNDLHQTAGADAVKTCIDVAAPCGVVYDWPELQPLIAKTEAQEYPLGALPPLIRGAVMEVCGFVKAPVPLVAMSALAALSVAIQAHVDVRRTIKLEGPCGLYLCCIADSGERKTSCDGYFTKAIHDYQSRQREKFKPLIQAYETEVEAWKSQRGGIQESIKSTAKAGKPTKALIDQLHTLDKLLGTPAETLQQATKALFDQLHALDKDRPIAPRVPRLLYSDATPEALALALVTGWPSGGVFSNEGGIVLGGHGMNKDTAMRNMARLNSFWDGKVPATDRATSEGYGDTAARMTMSLQVQEPTLRAFFENTKGLARGTGFLARFLVAWPESTMGTRMFSEPPDGWPELAAFNQRLTAILDRQAPVDNDGVLSPTMLALAPDAKDAWVKFHDAIETELRPAGELFDLRDVGSKAADNVARMAALFHVFAGSIGPIDFDCVESAAQVVAWHLIEAKRFLGELAMPPELANPARLEKWLIEYCKSERVSKVSTKVAQQYGPGGLRDKTIIDATVNELADLGRARLLKEGKKKLIELRPELLEATA